MKKLNFILLCAFVALFTTSCGENSSAYKKLQKQYDSLIQSQPLQIKILKRCFRSSTKSSRTSKT